MTTTPPEVSAALFRQQLEYLVEAADEMRGDVRALGAAINGTSGLSQRVASVEQTHRDCEARAKVNDFASRLDQHGERIAALEDNRASMWKLIGGTLITVLVAALLFILQQLGVMPM